jgi:hypothetical protein
MTTITEAGFGAAIVAAALTTAAVSQRRPPIFAVSQRRPPIFRRRRDSGTFDWGQLGRLCGLYSGLELWAGRIRRPMTLGMVRKHGSPLW